MIGLMLNKVSSEKSKTLKAIGSIKINEAIKIDGFMVHENENHELMVTIPSYSIEQEDGSRQYKSYLAFNKDMTSKTADGKESKFSNLKNVIDNQFKRMYLMEEKEGHLDIIDNSDIRVNMNPYTNEKNKSLLGIGSMFIGDSIKVDNIKLLNGEKGIFLGLPSRNTGKTNQETGKEEYSNVVNIINKAIKDDVLNKSIISYKKNQNKKQIEVEVEEEKETQKGNKKEKSSDMER